MAVDSMTALVWFLPTAFVVAVVAAFGMRWADRIRGRRLDAAHAAHRRMIVDLRVRVAAYEREQEREAARAAWRAIGTMANEFVHAVREAFRPSVEAVSAIIDGLNAPPKSAPPRDPRMSTGFPRRGR
jgi:hypothetical protein